MKSEKRLAIQTLGGWVFKVEVIAGTKQVGKFGPLELKEGLCHWSIISRKRVI